MRLLLADDDEDIRYVTAKLLALDGWEVITADSGSAALELLDTEQFDAAVLDHNMPTLTGLEVMTRRRTRGDRTPFFLWTGFTLALEAAGLAAVQVELLEKADVLRLRARLSEIRAAAS